MTEQGYIYLICEEENINGIYKIGFTKKDPNKRLKQLQTGNQTKLILYDYFKTSSESVERKIHRYFVNQRVNNEWFKLSEKDIRDLLDEDFRLLEFGDCFL